MTYRMALSANPKDADARLQIGTIYARNGIEEVALKEFEAILAHDPKHASAHNNRGNLFFARAATTTARSTVIAPRRAPTPPTAASA